MKRILAILVLAFLFASFAGCKDKTASATAKPIGPDDLTVAKKIESATPKPTAMDPSLTFWAQKPLETYANAAFGYKIKLPAWDQYTRGHGCDVTVEIPRRTSYELRPRAQIAVIMEEMSPNLVAGSLATHAKWERDCVVAWLNENGYTYKAGDHGYKTTKAGDWYYWRYSTSKNLYGWDNISYSRREDNGHRAFAITMTTPGGTIHNFEKMFDRVIDSYQYSATSDETKQRAEKAAQEVIKNFPVDEQQPVKKAPAKQVIPAPKPATKVPAPAKKVAPAKAPAKAPVKTPATKPKVEKKEPEKTEAEFDAPGLDFDTFDEFGDGEAKRG